MESKIDDQVISEPVKQVIQAISENSEPVKEIIQEVTEISKLINEFNDEFSAKTKPISTATNSFETIINNEEIELLVKSDLPNKIESNISNKKSFCEKISQILFKK